MTQPLNLLEYEALAQEKLPEMVYGYYASGANDEITLSDNRRAYDAISLRPRMLRGVETRDTSVTVLGKTLPSPVMIAPMGFMKMGHEDGELAVARAAGAHGLPMVLSTMSTYSIEDVQSAANAPLWFQLYIFRDRAVTQKLIERAESAGFSALVVTIDTPLLGRREADIRNEFHLPDTMMAKNLMDVEMGVVSRADGDSGLSAYIASLWNNNLTWDDIDWVRSITDLPILVKGVLRGDDAQIAIEHGVDGVIVSNHGGRQLDTATATIRALPEVVEAVGGQVDVLIDGGIRRGTDVLKALALGAQAVLLGRPVLWGLAHDGEAGVKRVLDLLHDEFVLAMALAGCRDIAEITPDLIVR